MFLGGRGEALRVLRLMGARLCVYGGGEWPHFCDCKYGGPHERPGSEQSGCPELASIHAVVSAMTDEEWRTIGLRAHHVLAADVMDALVEERE